MLFLTIHLYKVCLQKKVHDGINNYHSNSSNYIKPLRWDSFIIAVTEV